jgi:acyl-ACP thioesterase
MNNVFYLDVAKLMLPEDVYEGKDFSRFRIMYRKAIKYGETVKCLYGETENAYIVTLKDADGDVRAIMELEK